MNATDEYRQKLVSELIEKSAEIDVLVVKSRQAAADVKLNYDRELEELRAKQRETTKKLQALEDPNSNAWENIGDGG
ncbi:MAG: coiled coil domain-containing protein [Methylococcales bacterium]|nr:coiled coil domain-containing protein [Methylococcales bacterium]